MQGSRTARPVALQGLQPLPSCGGRPCESRRCRREVGLLWLAAVILLLEVSLSNQQGPPPLARWSLGAWSWGLSLWAITISGAEQSGPGAKERACACAAWRVSAAYDPSAERTAPPTDWAPVPEAEMVGGSWLRPGGHIGGPEAAPRSTERKCSAACSRTERSAGADPARVFLPAALGDRARPQQSRKVRAGGGRAGAAGIGGIRAGVGAQRRGRGRGPR